MTSLFYINKYSKELRTVFQIQFKESDTNTEQQGLVIVDLKEMKALIIIILFIIYYCNAVIQS
jgi:hypothetical protein